MTSTPPVICLVTDRRRTGPIPGDGIAPLLGLIGSAALAGVDAGVDLIQIRESDLDDRTLEDVVRQAVALTRATTTQIIVNDRVFMAMLRWRRARPASISRRRRYRPSECDGSLRQGGSWDGRCTARLAPPRWLVGRSDGTAEAIRVTAAGAVDYLMVGTVFETTSKAGQAPIGPDGLAATVRAVRVPVLAIGGVTVGNVRLVGQAGAIGLAAIAELVDAGPQLDQVVENLRQQFDKGRSSLL